MQPRQTSSWQPRHSGSSSWPAKPQQASQLRLRCLPHPLQVPKVLAWSREGQNQQGITLPSGMSTVSHCGTPPCTSIPLPLGPMPLALGRRPACSLHRSRCSALASRRATAGGGLSGVSIPIGPQGGVSQQHCQSRMGHPHWRRPGWTILPVMDSGSVHRPNSTCSSSLQKTRFGGAMTGPPHQVDSGQRQRGLRSGAVGPWNSAARFRSFSPEPCPGFPSLPAAPRLARTPRSCALLSAAPDDSPFAPSFTPTTGLSPDVDSFRAPSLNLNQAGAHNHVGVEEQMGAGTGGGDAKDGGKGEGGGRGGEVDEGGCDVEIEPRFYGLRAVDEKEGSFGADVGIKLRWGPSNCVASSSGPPLPPPDFSWFDTLNVQELRRKEPFPVEGRPGWTELFVRVRTTSQVLFKLHNFPYDMHKLQVIVRFTSTKHQDIRCIEALQESMATPRLPDLGLQDWLVLRTKCYMRTVAPGNRFFLRSEAPALLKSEDENLTVSHQEQQQQQLSYGGLFSGAMARAAAKMTKKVKKRSSAAPGGTALPDAAQAAPKPWQDNMIVTPPQKKEDPKLEFVMEFLVQRKAAYWFAFVYLPLLAMELIVPMTFVLPIMDLAGRLTLAVTLVIAPAVFRTSLSQRIPLVGYLTSTDRHFIFVYIYILGSCVVHTAMRLMLHLGWKPSQVSDVNLVCGLGFVVALATYHLHHFWHHFWPYMKRLSMFERRSFYAPPVVTTMDKWSKADAAERASRRAAGQGAEGSGYDAGLPGNDIAASLQSWG